MQTNVKEVKEHVKEIIKSLLFLLDFKYESI